MGIMNIKQGLVAFCFTAALLMTGCQTSTIPAGTADTAARENKISTPQRVDIRGSVIRSRYDRGQVMLEVEGVPSPETRYNRAYVLVQPTTQMIDEDGRSISLSELRQGQNVAILLRGGGQGNFVGTGVARVLWVEPTF